MAATATASVASRSTITRIRPPSAGTATHGPKVESGGHTRPSARSGDATHSSNSRAPVPAHAQKSNMPIYLGAGGAVALVVIVIAVATSGTAQKADKPLARNDAPKNEPKPAQTPSPASASQAPAPPAPTPPAAKQQPQSPAPATTPTPFQRNAPPDAPREEDLAKADFTKLEADLKILSDTNKQVAAIDEFVKAHPNTLESARARTMKDKLLKPAVAAAPEQKMPDHPEAIVNRANDLIKKADFAGAIAVYDDVIKGYDKEPIFFQNRADAKRMAGDIDGMAADTARSLALSENSSGAWALHAIASYGLKRDDDYKKSIDKSALMNGISAPQMEQALAAECQRARMIVEGKALEARAPVTAQEFMARGLYRISIGKRVGGITDLKEAVKQDPALGPSGLFTQMAEASRVDKNHKNVLKYLRQWAEAKPETAEGLNAYAWELLTSADPDLQNPKLALTMAEKAGELSTMSNPAILDTLALAYFKNNNIKSAIATEQTAVNLLPANTLPEVKAEYEKRLQEFKAAEGK